MPESDPPPVLDLTAPEPPPPAAPEDADMVWLRDVYQGDNMPQLTVRAVLMGGFLGMLMSVANLYTTLKIGWSFGVAITACVLSYVIWNAMRLLSNHRLTPMSMLENNCMQSTASAAGYSTGSTLATAFGALLLMEGVHQPWWVLASFTLFTAALGVFLAVPMKRQMINQEKLPFPTGIAAAATLRSLYSQGRESLRKAYVLLGGLATGVLVGILNTPEGTLKFLDRFFEKTRLHLPELIPAAGYKTIGGKSLLGFGFEPSALLIAAGMIVGPRVCLSMLAGSLALYLWIGPSLIGLDAASAGQADYLINIPLIGGGTVYHLPRWALWGGTAVMVFGSLSAMALQWRTVVRSFRLFRRQKSSSAAGSGQRLAEDRLASVEVPTRWLIIGMIPIYIGLLLIQLLAFHINFLLGTVAVVMSFFLSLVACRATGETDTTPVGAMGKVMQLLFAVISPPSATNTQISIQHNLMSAATAANSASSSADLLTDLKSGYLLGANPRKQFIAQFLGIFFGTVAVVPAWLLMVPNKEVLEKFNPPATNMWKAVAELLSGKGLAMLPESAKWAIVIGALLGIVIPLIEKMVPKARAYFPSTMGLGLSWVMPFANCQAFAIGAVLAWIWSRLHNKTAEPYTVPVASGLIAGESLVKALIAMAATAIGFCDLS